MKGFRPALRREWADLVGSPLVQAQLLWLPVAGIALLWVIFFRGVAVDIPVAVIDEDRTSLSRQLVRMIDATPGLNVSEQSGSVPEARDAVWRGDVEAIVLVPRDFSNDLKRGLQSEFVAWYNAQFLLTGNTIARELQLAGLTFSATVEARGRLARGETPEAVAINVMPLSTRRDTLYNPQLNYVPFLLNGLAFALLQMFAMLAAVRVVGRELREGTAGAWLESADGRTFSAVLAKLILPTVAYVLIGVAWLAALHGWLGWPMNGSWPLVLGGVLLLVLAYETLGLLTVAVTANYRFASSVAAFITAPAFAFCGLTYPLEAMPDIARIWGSIQPLTAFIRMYLDQAVGGATVAASSWQVVFPALVVAVGMVIAVPLLGWRARHPEYWGSR